MHRIIIWALLAACTVPSEERDATDLGEDFEDSTKDTAESTVQLSDCELLAEMEPSLSMAHTNDPWTPVNEGDRFTFIDDPTMGLHLVASLRATGFHGGEGAEKALPQVAFVVLDGGQHFGGFEATPTAMTFLEFGSLELRDAPLVWSGPYGPSPGPNTP